MTSTNTTARKKRFQLWEHPWIGLFVFIITTILVISITSDVLTPGSIWHATSFHILTLFVVTPFLLRLPKGKSSFRQYLSDIRLSNLHPLGKLLLLALSCYLILALCQAAGSLVYRLLEGKAVTWSFIRTELDITREFPPQSASMLNSLPSAFEEIGFRGVILALFLTKYTQKRAIVFSAFGFGLMHLLNLAGDRETVWVVGQVIWAFLLGLFYGYLVLKTNSLLPAMIFHYLSNVFVWALTSYIQTNASTEVQVAYGLIFTFGIVPVTLLIIWVRFFAQKWLPKQA